MKRFIFAMLAALCIAPAMAQADTLELFATGGWGALHQYHNVPTNLCTQVPCEVEATVTIYISTLASVYNPPPRSIELWFGNDLANAYFGPYYGSGVPTVLTNKTTGAQLTVTLDETSRTVKGGGSGRGGYASHTVWTLLDGEVVR